MKKIKLNKKTKIYLLIAFAWTWFGWIGAYLIGNLYGVELVIDTTIFNVWQIPMGSDRFLPQILFTLAVYGPFVGFLITSKFSDLYQKTSTSRNLWHYVLLIPIFSVLPAIILSFSLSYFDSGALPLTSALVTILLYFISNLFTSGTEEFGWRGVLYPELKATGLSFWDNALKGGLIWAVWHYPLLFIMYVPLGIAVLVPSLIGFTASIIAMNYITNYIYEKSHSISSVIVLHALNNTMSFVLIFLFPNNPFTIGASLMAWVVVWWLEKKSPELNQNTNA